MNCIACGSRDTISYWHKADDSPSSVVLKECYPRARRCVDCGTIEHDPERRAVRTALSTLPKGKP